MGFDLSETPNFGGLISDWEFSYHENLLCIWGVFEQTNLSYKLLMPIKAIKDIGKVYVIQGTNKSFYYAGKCEINKEFQKEINDYYDKSR